MNTTDFLLFLYHRGNRIRKRLLVLLSALILSFGLVGCEMLASAPRIDENQWTMTLIQLGVDGEPVFCSPQTAKNFSGLPHQELICTAQDGKLILDDCIKENQYIGTYSLTDESTQSNTYQIELAGSSGYAVTSMTKYEHGGMTPTLILVLRDYTITFLPVMDE